LSTTEHDLLASLTGQQPAWKRLLLDNPDLFLLRYFGPDSSSPRLWDLQPFHVELVRTVTTERSALILYPAAHGKTTLVSTLLPIWALCKDPNVRISIIAKNSVDAENIGQAIQTELLSNEELIEDFGPFEPSPESNKPFSTKRLSVAKRTSRAKEPTIALFGAQSRNALGQRSDWTICDDIVHDVNSATPESREKLRDWFMQGPMTQGERYGARMTVIGTRFDPEDLYGALMEFAHPETGEGLWAIREVDAIVDEDNETTLWPEKWPWLRLMELKAQMGTLNFNKRLRNIAVDKSRMVFKEEYVKGGWVGRDHYPGCLDREYKAGEYDETWRRYAGFDPAIGLTKSRKFCAHITLAVGSCREHDKCLWVVDLFRDQMTLPQQCDLILERHHQYGCVATWVEANSYQLGLYQAIKDKMDERGQAFRIDPHYTTRTNKPDPEIGVHRMAPWFENGKVHIPQGNRESLRKMRQLVDELVQYPSGKYTDTVMALWIAWLASEVAGPQFKSFNRLERRPFWKQQGAGRKVILNPVYAQEEVDVNA
jgi:hypothetical protein